MVGEVTANYIIKMVKPILDGRFRSVCVTSEAFEDYNQILQTEIGNTVYDSCTHFWNERGKNTGECECCIGRSVFKPFSSTV